MRAPTLPLMSVEDEVWLGQGRVVRLILPKSHPDLGREGLADLPMFFLAGPIRGGGDWHARMSVLLARRAGDCLIVNPSRYGEGHPDYRHRLVGAENRFPHQTAWERHYLSEAAQTWPRGCIVFWLARESAEHPRTDGQPYAMDTRGEIGEWRGRLMRDRSLRVAIGGDPDFPGLRTIRRNTDLALGPDFPIFETMEAVAERAAELALR
jgi:hypothetical protein